GRGGGGGRVGGRRVHASIVAGVTGPAGRPPVGFPERAGNLSGRPPSAQGEQPMRIVVAVKYVPDIHADRGFEDGRVVRRADEGTLNELDENAVEAALRLKEARPEEERETSEVVVLTVAGPDADGAVRRAYQLGADRGVRVSDDAIAGSDYFGTARV